MSGRAGGADRRHRSRARRPECLGAGTDRGGRSRLSRVPHRHDPVALTGRAPRNDGVEGRAGSARAPDETAPRAIEPQDAGERPARTPAGTGPEPPNGNSLYEHINETARVG